MSEKELQAEIDRLSRVRRQDTEAIRKLLLLYLREAVKGSSDESKA